MVDCRAGIDDRRSNCGLDNPSELNEAQAAEKTTKR
jgi:hypothetical protein